MNRASTFASLISLPLALSALAPTASAATSSKTGATNPTVGALFANGSSRTHICTASVLNSPGGDLIITAAHCVHGNGAGMRFTPGYRYGSAPYGSWTTIRAYVSPAWLKSQNPQADVAILRVNKPIQRVVGGNRLSTTAPPSGLPITVPAYATGSGDHQLQCTANVFWTSGYPSFACGGYPGGTSGAPFLHAGTVYGVIGGLHQGGCTPSVSYSTNLAGYGQVAATLLSRAQRYWSADTNIPSAGSSGC